MTINLVLIEDLNYQITVNDCKITHLWITACRTVLQVTGACMDPLFSSMAGLYYI